MAHLHPLDPDSVPELREAFAHIERSLGFVPNSLLTTARPGVVQGCTAPATATMLEGTVDTRLKRMTSDRLTDAERAVLDVPFELATEHLGPQGWDAGEHRVAA